MNKPREEIPGNNKTRSASRERVVLVAGDLSIFKLVYEYRLLRREHLSALLGRPLKRLHRRLLKLVLVEEPQAQGAGPAGIIRVLLEGTR